MELDFLEQILEESVDETKEYVHKLYAVPEQNGPFRFFDTEKRCSSRGCSSPTHYKLQGISYCSKHCLLKMNDMLIELGVTQ